MSPPRGGKELGAHVPKSAQAPDSPTDSPTLTHSIPGATRLACGKPGPFQVRERQHEAPDADCCREKIARSQLVTGPSLRVVAKGSQPRNSDYCEDSRELATPWSTADPIPAVIAGSNSLAAAGRDSAEPPRRRYSCENYGTCLNLAAAMNWDSFTCRGCSGIVNEKLLWRARQAVKHDAVVRTLCEFPTIPTLGAEALDSCHAKKSCSSTSAVDSPPVAPVEPSQDSGAIKMTSGDCCEE